MMSGGMTGGDGGANGGIDGRGDLMFARVGPGRELRAHAALVSSTRGWLAPSSSALLRRYLQRLPRGGIGARPSVGGVEAGAGLGRVEPREARRQRPSAASQRAQAYVQRIAAQRERDDGDARVREGARSPGRLAASARSLLPRSSWEAPRRRRALMWATKRSTRRCDGGGDGSGSRTLLARRPAAGGRRRLPQSPPPSSGPSPSSQRPSLT